MRHFLLYIRGEFRTMEHDWINNEGTMNTATLKTARFVQSFQTIDFLGFTDPPLKKLVKLYGTASGKNNLSLDLLREGCMRCYIPEEPEFELQSGTENIYRVLILNSGKSMVCAAHSKIRPGDS